MLISGPFQNYSGFRLLSLKTPSLKCLSSNGVFSKCTFLIVFFKHQYQPYLISDKNNFGIKYRRKIAVSISLTF